MARLPDFTSLGTTPAPQAPLGVARVDVSPLEFTVRQGPGEAAIRGGAQLANAGAQMQEHIDTLRAEDAYNQLIQRRTELEASPEIGFANVKGYSAIDRKFYEDYNRRFTDSATAIENTLSTPNQKQLFKNRAAVAGAQYQSALLTHMSQQTSAFADNTEKATVKLEVANASNAKSDAEFDTSMTRIRGVLDARGARLHESPAVTEENKREAVDSAWTERIKVLANYDPLAAQKMYKDNETNIGPANKVVLEYQLKQLVTPVQAKNLAMSVIAGAKVDDIAAAVTVGGDNALNGIITQRERVDDGLPRTKVDTKANLSQWVADVEAAAQKVKPNDPVFRDAAVSQLKGYVNTIVASQDGISRAAHGLLMNAALGPDGKNKPLTLDELLATQDLRAAWAVTSDESRRGFYAMLEHNARPAPLRTNPLVIENAFRRIHLPNDDPNKIRTPGELAPLFARGLNRTDYDWLKKEIDDQQTPEGQRLSDTRKGFFDAIRPQFDKTTMFNFDAKGKEDFYKFQQYGSELERKYKAQSGKDVYDLYNPNSPEYLGKKVQSFQRTLDEQVRGMAERLRQPTQRAEPLPTDRQRKEGETIDDYAKRVGIVK
jgi:hypothetical protein